VLREWTKVFLFTVLGFPFLVMVIDLVDKLDTYLGRGIGKEKVALSYVYFLPEAISLVLPVAVLFAVVFTVGVLGRYSELTAAKASGISFRSEEHTSELQSRSDLVCRLLLEKKKKQTTNNSITNHTSTVR